MPTKPLYKRNARTIPRTFRITHTQDILLDQPQFKSKASAIVRVLLKLYLNKKIHHEVDLLVTQELQEADAAELATLDNFRKKLIAQGERKRNGSF